MDLSLSPSVSAPIVSGLSVIARLYLGLTCPNPLFARYTASTDLNMESNLAGGKSFLDHAPAARYDAETVSRVNH